MSARELAVAGADIDRMIINLRGQKVMIDADLARLYGVETRVLNQAVRRNRERFPDDFVFQLTEEEKAEVITNCDHLASLKFSPVLPYAFTEHGAVMAAAVLNSARAVEVSVFVVRAFVRMRKLLSGHRELALKLAELERRVTRQDARIAALFDAVRQMMRLPASRK
ncbi:MAG: ORF6N domain-containing protein [candidate division WOR-3 bacterium]